MPQQNSFFQSSDGLKLFTQSWKVNDSVADLVLIHGLTDHSGRYQWVAEKLNEIHINVHAFDLRGHGRSEGDRAYISSFDQFLDDLDGFIRQLELEHDGFFLLGQSMGGLILTRYLLDHPDTKCKGLILCAPALKVGDDISPFLVKISSVLSWLLPTLKTEKFDPNHLSRDQEIVNKYDHDPLVYHDGIKARLGAEMIKTIQGLRASYQDFSFPVLILHGSGDQLADLQGSRWMYEEIASTDKSLEVLPGFYHEILNEPEKEAVIQKIIRWIKERT